MTETLSARFWAKVDKSGECWLWTAGKSHFGYGLIQVGTFTNNRQEVAHRVSWRLHFGPIPKGMCVCHKCDVPACVRPDHLFVGTQKENMHDMIKKGRRGYTGVRGEAHASAKLTELDVLEARAVHRVLKIGRRRLADAFGVSVESMKAVLRRTTWKHV